MFRILSGIAVPVAVLSAFALGRRYFPAAATKTESQKLSLSDLDQEFSGVTQWMFAGCMILVGAVMFMTIHQALVMANAEFATRDAPAAFTFYPETAVWLFLPLFAAVATTWDVSLWMWRLRSPARARLYEYWSNSRAGFNATKILRILTVSIVLPIAISTVLALPMHDSLRPNEIVSKGYGFSRAQTFRYSEATKLVLVMGFRKHGDKLLPNQHITVYFADGRQWSSHSIGERILPDDVALIDFLKRKTGLTVQFASARLGAKGMQN